MTTLLSRFAKLAERKRAPNQPISRFVNDSADRSYTKLAKSYPSTSDDARNYVTECAEPLDSEYTTKILEGADLIKKKLVASQVVADYEYQGSVTNNTHIKIHSDIDLLVITKEFVTLEAPLSSTPGREWQGSQLGYLIDLRKQCEIHLANGDFDSVDTDGAKSIAISSKSLPCKVDVVPANWLDTQQYRNTKNRIHRAIQVLDKRTVSRVKNLPFLHNYKLETADKNRSGMLRRLIRLVKSIRSDSDSPPLVNSYDITALCYNMPDSYWSLNCNDAEMLRRFLFFTLQLISKEDLRQTMMVPNGTRKVFEERGLQCKNLEQLWHQMNELAELAGLK